MQQHLIQLVISDYQKILTVGAIMVSAIIVFIGVLKPLLFNKIKNKLLRKSLLAFSDVLFSFAATAIHFLIEGYTWEYYWISAIGASIGCIVTYWVYENTCLRNLIEKLGWAALMKFAKIGLMILGVEENKVVGEAIIKADQELKKASKTELKNASELISKDKELKNL